MTRFRAALVAAVLGIVIPGPTGVASAQVWNWTVSGFDETEFDAIHAAVQLLLREDKVGASRPWHSASGKSGRVHLLQGGEKAGSDHAIVGITRYDGKREVRVLKFQYRKDLQKGWATCG